MRFLSVVVSFGAALVAGGADHTAAQFQGKEDAVAQDSGEEQEQESVHTMSNTTTQASPTQRLRSLSSQQATWNSRWRSGRRSWLARAASTFRAARARGLRAQATARRNLRSSYGRKVMVQWRAKRPNVVIRVVRDFQRRFAAMRRSHSAALRRQHSLYVGQVRRYVRGQASRWSRRQAWYRRHRSLLISLRNLQNNVRRTNAAIRGVRSRSAAWRRRWSAAVRGRMAYYNRVLRSRLTSAVRRHVASRRALRSAYGRVVMRQWRAKQTNAVIRTVRQFQAALKRKNAAHARNLTNIRVGIAGAKRRYRAVQSRRLRVYNGRIRAQLSRLSRHVTNLRARVRGVNRALSNNSKRKVAM